MREIYNYSGLGGRVSNRDLQSHVNGTQGESFTQGWSYNDLGDVASISYPRCVWASCNGASTTAPTVGFTYTRGWLTSVPGYANSISYHANGMVNQVAHTNGVTYTQALDPNAMRRPASYSTTGATTNWTSGAYTYDGAGNVAAIGSNSYLYDGVSRLTSATQYTGAASGTGPIATQGAAYDVYGNITSLTTNGTGVTTSTSTSTNRLTGASYDAAGSMTWWNGNTYAYEPLGMTRNIVSSGVETVHIYTADDERAWTYQPGAPSRWTLRDLDGKVLRELKNDAGTWSAERAYVHRDGALLAAITPTETVHFHPDHLGTPRLITGTGGAYRSYHLYHPYGAEATAFNQDTERLKFTAHERDLGSLASAADDIDYQGARFMNLHVARYQASDPVPSWDVFTPQSWNRFAYTRGNPLKFIDPSGEDVVLAVGGPTADSAAGHVAIVLSGTVYSYATDYSKTGNDWGVPLADYLAGQAGKRETELLTLQASVEQEAQVLSLLTAVDPSTSDYSVLGKNCVSVSEGALDGAGILPNQPGPVKIDSAGNALQRGAPKALTPSQLSGQAKKSGVVQSTKIVGSVQGQKAAGWAKTAWNWMVGNAR
jgi:RHS repeat-associated protein